MANNQTAGGCYEIGYCSACSRNVQHFRGPKKLAARLIDAFSLYVLNYGPWFCSHCDRKAKSLPWIRKRQPTNRRISDRLNGAQRVGNFIRSDGLVLRKKRSGRYSRKYREGVVSRLLNGRTSVVQLTAELDVSEADLMAWISDLLEERDERIVELTSLLRSYSRAAENLIGIENANGFQYDENENMIEGRYERRKANQP